MIPIYQKESIRLFATKKTVEWLVNNTDVRVFNPITFSGYQRQINEKHCEKIVEYLRNDFFLPTAIICATNGAYESDSRLRVVDGQHRIHAFRMLQREDPIRYNEIRKKEMPVIVMESADEKVEIDTFITINKTSKKVDTSLAFVLKNKINKYATSEDLSMPKAEYLSVELALNLNSDEKNKLWFDKIIFEGSPKNTPQLISLNAFVKSTRTLFNTLAKKRMLFLGWNSEKDIENCLSICKSMISMIWNSVTMRWPELFEGDMEKRRIIQGAIGYSAINRVVVSLLDSVSPFEMDSFRQFMEEKIRNISLDSDIWLPGQLFSGFSSEWGYSIVAREILNSMR